jgi:hypothetical protein
MRLLPLDYSLCTNAECPLAKRCARYLTYLASAGGRILITDFQPIDGQCKSFIDEATR